MGRRLPDRPYNRMKTALFYLILLSISGCGLVAKETISPSPWSNLTGDCGTNVAKLTKENVKSLTNKRIIQEPVDLSPDRALGYLFQAKTGDKLQYNQEDQEKDKICIRVYTPEYKLLEGNKLTLKGEYLIRVSASQERNNVPLNIEVIPREKPTEAIEDYYSLVNKEQYRTAWNKLSLKFQLRSKSPTAYQDYTSWWNKVSQVKVINPKLIQEENTTAIVDSSLQYYMKGGRKWGHLLRLYLIWDEEKELWLIDDTKVR